MEYVNYDLKPLSPEEKSKFCSFENYISERREGEELTLLYRGEQERNIQCRLFKYEGDFSRKELFRRLFFFGEKARHFYMSPSDENLNILKDINDCSEETLEFIFKRMFNVVTTKKYALSKRVLENTCSNFIEYFSDISNSKEFVKIINGIRTDPKKIMVRNYYLYWLHVAGSTGIRDKTQLVSTSTDKKVAIDFSGKVKGGVILHYFIPTSLYDYVVAPWIGDDHQRIVSECNLPTYKAKGLYPEQEEVAAKGGLFPHFILGVELVSEKKFIINSNFKNISEDDFEQLLKNGFGIDQSNFYEKIRETNYISWIEIYGKGFLVERNT